MPKFWILNHKLFTIFEVIPLSLQFKCLYLPISETSINVLSVECALKNQLSQWSQNHSRSSTRRQQITMKADFDLALFSSLKISSSRVGWKPYPDAPGVKQSEGSVCKKENVIINCFNGNTKSLRNLLRPRDTAKSLSKKNNFFLGTYSIVFIWTAEHSVSTKL